MRLPEAIARTRFTTAAVIRMATADADGRPHLVVATFALDGDRIYLAVDEKPKATRNLRRLRNLRTNPVVALLADHYDDDWQELWWVRADGRAEIVSEPTAMAGPLGQLIAKYPQYRAAPPLGPVIVVEVERWVGWAARFERDAPDHHSSAANRAGDTAAED